MRIPHSSAGVSIRRAQHYVAGFSRYARQREDFFHGARHLPAKLFKDRFARAHHRFRLVPEKSCRPDVLLQLAWRGVGECFRIWIFLIKLFSHLIDAHVRALRGKNRGDQQLKNVFVLQLARRIRVRFIQFRENFRDALVLRSRCMSRLASLDALRGFRRSCFWWRGFLLLPRFLLRFHGPRSQDYITEARAPTNLRTTFPRWLC